MYLAKEKRTAMEFFLEKKKLGKLNSWIDIHCLEVTVSSPT